MSEMNSTRSAIIEALDRYGGTIGSVARRRSRRSSAARLPSPTPTMRAELDLARALDAGVADVRTAIDAELAASGAVDRVQPQRVSRERSLLRSARRRWMAVAAALVIAAGLGSASN